MIPEFSNEKLNFSDISPNPSGNSFVLISFLSALSTGNVSAKNPSDNNTFSILFRTFIDTF